MYNFIEMWNEYFYCDMYCVHCDMSHDKRTCSRLEIETSPYESNEKTQFCRMSRVTYDLSHQNLIEWTQS